MLNYHALTQGESESGAEFEDCELREYLTLRDKMSVKIDDSIRLTKCIQQDTTNAKHKQLAQTIFRTPNMTLGREASLFETYNPPSGSAAAPTTPTVNAVTNYQIVPRKSQFSIRRGLKTLFVFLCTSRPGKRQRFPCAICDSIDHLSHLCPRREEARRCLAQSSGRQTPSSNSSNRKPSVGWGTTKRGWGRDDKFSEGSK